MTSERLRVSFYKRGRTFMCQSAKMLLDQQISEAAIQEHCVQNFFICVFTLQPMLDILEIAYHPHLITYRL